MGDPTLGRVISEARKQLSMSQKELAEHIQISPQYLNDIERDRRSPSSDHMISQFANVLNLEADYLHYLNGRFPEKERKEKLSPEEFDVAMSAFRRPDGVKGKGKR